jgi:arginine decarboxylase-like protein
MNDEYYEKEIRKNMNELDTLNSKAEFSDEKELHVIVEQMGDIISTTEKTVKDYNIYNVMNNNDDQTKTKEIQKQLSDSKKRWKKLKEKLKEFEKKNINSIKVEGEEDGSSQTLTFNSFNKIQLASRSTIEMEDMSGNILGDLNNQSSQMKNVSSKIGLINEDIDTSNNVLTKMFNRQSRDKKIIIIFGLILLIAFLGTLTYKIIIKFK